MRVVSAKNSARNISKKYNKKMHAHEFRSLGLFCALESESRTVWKATNLAETFELIVKRLGRPCFYTK